MTELTAYTSEDRLAAATALAPFLRRDTDTLPDREHILVLRDECFFNVLSHWAVRGDVRKAMNVPDAFKDEVEVLVTALGEVPAEVTTAAKPFGQIVESLPHKDESDYRYTHTVFAIMVVALMGAFSEGTFLRGTQDFNRQVEVLTERGVPLNDFPQVMNALELVEIAKISLQTGGSAILRTYGPEGLAKWFATNLQYKFGAVDEAQGTAIIAEALGIDPDQITHMEMDLAGPVDDSDLGRLLRDDKAS